MKAKARGTRTLWGALTLTAALVVAGCGGSAIPHEEVAATNPGSSAPTQADLAMARPGPFKPGLSSPDILVQSPVPLSADLVAQLRQVKGTGATVQFSMATFYSEETAVTYAAVDPRTFRAFTPGPTATLDEVWDRVADGEIALRPDLKQVLAAPGDYVSLGNDDGAQRAHIGAYAPLVDRSKIGAVLNERWAQRLGMPEGNALLISTGARDPAPVLARIKAIAKDSAALSGSRFAAMLLAPDVDPNAAQLAVVTGGAVSQVIKPLTYTANRDGTVNVDPAWVREYIRTENVPILGNVTCNKEMLKQLRAALTDVVRAGLANTIHRGEYGGCYVPRFIAKDPSRGLSFHTFGTAIDLNVPGNLRGTVGEMNRTVVQIFKRWGFAWGGDWSYTDPMHFELAAIVKVR